MPKLRSQRVLTSPHNRRDAVGAKPQFVDVTTELPSDAFQAVGLATAWSPDWHPAKPPKATNKRVAGTRVRSDFLTMPGSLLNGQAYRPGSLAGGLKTYLSTTLTYMTPDLTAALFYCKADEHPHAAAIVQLSMPPDMLKMPILNVGKRAVVGHALSWCIDNIAAVRATLDSVGVPQTGKKRATAESLARMFMIAYGVKLDKTGKLARYSFKEHAQMLIRDDHVDSGNIPSKQKANFEAAANDDGQCIRASFFEVDAVVHPALLAWAQAAYGAGTMIGSGRLYAPVETEDFYQHSEVVSFPQGAYPCKAIAVHKLMSGPFDDFLERVTRPSTRTVLEEIRAAYVPPRSLQRDFDASEPQPEDLGRVRAGERRSVSQSEQRTEGGAAAP